MQEKFIAPKSKEEFLDRVGKISARGAKSVVQGLDVKIRRVAGALVEERNFFQEVAEYHATGTIPERFTKKDEQTT